MSFRNLIMQEVAYSGDKVPVRVQIQSKGYEKRTARLSVLLNKRRVSSRVVKLDGGMQFEEIDFRVDVYEKGAARIEVVIEPFDNEVSIVNNRVARSVRVVNEKVNVLYLEGNARWEYRYLRAILKRDPRINATFVASNVGPEVARNSSEHVERFPIQGRRLSIRLDSGASTPPFLRRSAFSKTDQGPGRIAAHALRPHAFSRILFGYAGGDHATGT